MSRPKQFIEEIALQQALETFWQKGYASTSMSDLAESMNLRPGSIYATFGSKKELLLACIDKYGCENFEKLKELLLAPTPKRETFCELFQKVSLESNEPAPRGCLLVNILLEVANLDQEIGNLAKSHLENTKNLFRDTLQQAQTTGELSDGKSVESLAPFLMSTMFALRVMARARASQQDLQATYENSLTHVFS
ncbi:TetR/AcrR family transcriptional regulator [Luteolibacter sp. AS25]|uniref:TetR/AcrR family transcriptional regulator n=1 Tax=Luteolibacter sp. AS25 TaxID=3135776 RepID=UPI00398B1770